MISLFLFFPFFTFSPDSPPMSQIDRTFTVPPVTPQIQHGHTSPWLPHAALHSIPENRLGRSFVASAPPTRHKSTVNLSSVVKMRDPTKTRKPRPVSVATSMPSFVRVETDTPKSSRSKSTDRQRRGRFSYWLYEALDFVVYVLGYIIRARRFHPPDHPDTWFWMQGKWIFWNL